ncbi:stretch-activated cation channel Mid1 [Cubamyces menziesii]|nr:stretch-activated cation channel Mid1 [Cubamyces menziesii]
MLPISLFAVLQGFLLLAEAQQAQQLALEKVVDLSTSSLPNPPTFRISPSADPLFISVALCNASDNTTRFFLTNDTTISNPGPSDVDSVNTSELVMPDTGFNEWSNWFTNGGILSVLKGDASVEFELLVSAHNSSAVGSPFVGDTTANQALLFSPPFNPVPTEEPTFPNYTLPAANLSFPPTPSPPTNYSLVIAPTASNGLSSLPRTVCALKNAVSKQGTILVTPASGSSQGLWLRDSDGWRWQWLVNGLNPRTNYTLFALRDGVLASSEPFYFVTKSATFNCPLVHSLPFCPTVSYAVPIAPPRGIATTHTAATLPGDVTDTVLSVLANFTTTLSTLACGRDYYSPLVTCADCQQAYRRWLCAVAFPRCGDSSSGSFIDAQGAQLPLPALQTVPKGAPPRNPVLPPFGSDYQTLLPCLETCNAADRACPNFLNFKCPLPRFTAADSYAVGYIDSGEEGVLGGGSTGVAQDEFGHVWCNLG